MQYIYETFVRWRTWIVNAFFAIVLVLPDLLQALLGFNWGELVPQQYMPWVTLLIVVVNVWMRPRPAVIKTDPEVKFQQLVNDIKDADYETGDMK